ncbi:MAG: hypothetical protein H6828_08130 [Planctomycetes bacterium]|nr:hypothetical protein [Planctomycetota bacterium]
MRRLLPLLPLLTLLAGCRIFAGRPAQVLPNQVVVVGTLGARHLTSQGYGLDDLERLLRDLAPQVVLVELPPGRYEQAWDEFVRTGAVTEPYVARFPEYTRVLFPMALEGRFRVVPCSAWTEPLERRREELRSQWRFSRPKDTREVEAARAEAEATMEREGLFDSVEGVHSARFRELAAEGLEPYERLFGRDLGPGGWSALQRAHASLVDQALDLWSGDGVRVVVLFDAWSQAPLRAHLARRDDLEPLELDEALTRP